MSLGCGAIADHCLKMAYDSGVALRKCGPRLHKMPLFYIKLHHFQITSLFPHSTLKISPPLGAHHVVSEAASTGPGAVRGQPINANAPGSPQTPENMQQMKKLMEQELKSDKYKTNNNKGYVFTLMPLYAIGVGVFAAYKFLKVRKINLNFESTSMCTV